MESFQELGRFGKSGTRSSGRPLVRVVDGELPGSSPSHGETADQDAVLIDPVIGLRMGERLEEIDLAGEFVRIAVATIEMQYDGTFRRDFATLAAEALLEKGELAESLAAPMAPEVQADPSIRIGFWSRRDLDTVWLPGVIDLRLIGTNDGPGFMQPGCLASLEGMRSCQAQVEQLIGEGEFFFLEDLIVAKSIGNGFVTNAHIG